MKDIVGVRFKKLRKIEFFNRKRWRLKKGDKVINLDDPEFEGYTFIGWYLNDEEYNFDTPVNSSITLGAMWKEN